MNAPRDAASPLWFVPRPLPHPRVRLICLPWAGGAATAFAGWAARLPRDIELRAAQLPGRPPRFREPPRRRLDELVDELLPAVVELLDAPYALFGHSMGAGLAYALAARLIAAGHRGPAHLFVSAARPPHLPPDHPPLSPLADGDLVRELAPLGGIPEPLLRERELLDLLLPTIRADLAAFETWRHPGGPLLPTPLSALGGLDDSITRPQLEAWGELTSGPFAVRMFWGGHFYLQPQEAQVADYLARLLAEVKSAR